MSKIFFVGILLLLFLFAGCGQMQAPEEKKSAELPEEIEPETEAIVEPSLPVKSVETTDFPEFEMGNIVFNTPDTMKLAESRGIQLLLSPDLSIQQLEARMQEAGPLRQRQIRISRVMEAKLTGKGFKVEPVTETLQLVNPKGVTEWRWEVTAMEAGSRKLYLTMNAILEVDGKERPHTIQTLHEVIEIQVTWQQRVSAFVSNNWQWLWTAIVVPFFGWLHERRKQRKPKK